MLNDQLTRCYNFVNAFASGLNGLGAHLPTVDSFLPASSYVRLIAFVDDAFDEFISSNGLTAGKDVNGKIKLLQSHGLQNVTALHAVRQARNRLAHDPSASCGWADVDSAMQEAHRALEDLGLVGQRPKYDFYMESKMRSVSVEGWTYTRDYFYGLKANGEKIVEVSWAVCTR